MKLASKIALGAALALFSNAAVAADAVPAASVPIVVPQVPTPAPAFDWSGPYLGAHIGRNAQFDLFAWEEWVFGLQAGYNFVRNDRLVVGLEASFGFQSDAGTAELLAGVFARGGIVLGDRVLAYAKLGIGTEKFEELNFQYGGGVEIGLGTAASIFAEVLGVYDFTGACCDMVAQAGINFHPGNR